MPTAKPEQEPAKLLDVASVASMFDCSERHIYRLMELGKIPSPVRIGNLIRWDRETIREWVNRGCPDANGGGDNG